MSLRLRITLVVVLVVTAAVAVVGQRVYAAAERELVEEVDTEVQGRAAGFGTFVSGPQFREVFTGVRCRTLPPTGSLSAGIRSRSSTRRPGTTSSGGGAGW